MKRVPGSKHLTDVVVQQAKRCESRLAEAQKSEAEGNHETGQCLRFIAQQRAEIALHAINQLRQIGALV